MDFQSNDLVWNATLIVLYLILTYIMCRLWPPPAYLAASINWTTFFKMVKEENKNPYRMGLYVIVPLGLSVVLIGLLRGIASV
jgi:hypothetical protein